MNTRARASIWVAAVLAVCLPPIPVPAAGLSLPSASAPVTVSESLQQRGKQMRAQINAKYRELKKADMISIAPKNGTDVSAIVARFIPPGTPFHDANRILIEAGCRTPYPKEGKVHADVLIGGGFSYGVYFGVTLSPRAPGDFSVVEGVAAAISAQSL